MIRSTHGLDAFGLAHAEQHWNLTPAALVEAAVRSGEGKLTNSGPFHAVTTPHTGRSPNDRFLVREASTAEDVWWGNANVALEASNFLRCALMYRPIWGRARCTSWMCMLALTRSIA